MLGMYSADDVVNIIHEFGALVVSLTALAGVLVVLRKAGKAQTDANQAQADANQAKVDSAVANKSAEIAQHRVDRVADTQNTLRSDMTIVAANSIPKDAASALLNAQPGGPDAGSSQAKDQVSEGGQVGTQEANK